LLEHEVLVLSTGLLIEKLFRDARAAMIEDGANDALALVASRQIVDTFL
jgi:alkylation response protein AidB-like acyl-CoA dehydrogenase